MSDISASLLGKPTVYLDCYNPSVLFAIERGGNGSTTGVDIWHGYDFTWLDTHNVPQFGFLTIYVPAESPYLIESKSLKLYLFSFANSVFNNSQQVITVIEEDLSRIAGSKVTVTVGDVSAANKNIYARFAGEYIDNLEVVCDSYTVDASLLQADPKKIVTEELCSDLFKSNCLVTGKPDWASVKISYTGPEINRAQLLKYLISYRDYMRFHEQCIEQVFFDILHCCKPSSLTVEGRYNRRGGLDINPIRSNCEYTVNNTRLFRQ